MNETTAPLHHMDSTISAHSRWLLNPQPPKSCTAFLFLPWLATACPAASAAVIVPPIEARLLRLFRWRYFSPARPGRTATPREPPKRKQKGGHPRREAPRSTSLFD